MNTGELLKDSSLATLALNDNAEAALPPDDKVED